MIASDFCEDVEDELSLSLFWIKGLGTRLKKSSDVHSRKWYLPFCSLSSHFTLPCSWLGLSVVRKDASSEWPSKSKEKAKLVSYVARYPNLVLAKVPYARSMWWLRILFCMLHVQASLPRTIFHRIQKLAIHARRQALGHHFYATLSLVSCQNFVFKFSSLIVSLHRFMKYPVTSCDCNVYSLSYILSLDDGWLHSPGEWKGLLNSG